jgi:DNA-binding response OmpR family regulator
MRPFIGALSYHILVVENEPGLSEMIRAALECDGFHVTFAPKKAAAMSLLSSLKIDLVVVVDVNLPDGLGTEVAQHAASLTIPRILMTGHPQHIMEFDQKGIAYIAKPFRPEQLRKEVRDRLIRTDRV